MNIFTYTTSVDNVITETTAAILNNQISMIQNPQPPIGQVTKELVLSYYDHNRTVEENQTVAASFSWREFGANLEGIYLSRNNGLQVVADNNTPIPGGKGNFVFFDSFSVSKNNVAFEGFGSSLDQQGIYISCNGELQVVADRNTAAPNGTGNFIGFSLSNVGLDGNKVAFFAFCADSEGIYLSCDGELQVIANKNTPIPGGMGNFTSFFDPGICGGNVVFVGAGNHRQQGIYISTDNSLQVVVDTNTTIPGETRKFSRFSNIVLDGNNLAFVGYVCIPEIGTSDSPVGIYAYIDGSLFKVIDFSSRLDGKKLSDLRLDSNAIAWQFPLRTAR